MRMRHRAGVRNDNWGDTDLRERAQMVRFLKSAYEQVMSLRGEMNSVTTLGLPIAIELFVR